MYFVEGKQPFFFFSYSFNILRLYSFFVRWSLMEEQDNREHLLILGQQSKPGVGLVVRVAAWDPRVLSSSPIGR